MFLLVDNYDSFTYNLVQLLYTLDVSVEVRRNREITVKEALEMKPEGILLSPGPGRPENAGVMMELISAVYSKIPLLGICLGHQAIGAFFGGKIVAAKYIMHGKISKITHDGKGLFSGIRNEFKAVRYHSLAVDETSLANEIEVTARSEDKEIMGIRHKQFLIEGIQYHPESIMTPTGKTQLSNFINLIRSCRKGESIYA